MKWSPLLGAALLAACSSARPPPARPAPRTHTQHAVVCGKEDKLGREIDEQLRRRFELYPDRDVAGYVRGVGARVARQARYTGCRWTFRVLDEPAVNAFAFPGGYVYLTRGMLAELDSEAALAAVLGHEVGHIAAHHSLERTDWFEAQPYDPTRAQLIHFYERSRDNEREADQLAVGYLARAGYDPRAVADMLSALLDVERGDGADLSTSLWDDHPATAARIARASQAAARLALGRWAGARYRKAIDGLVFGNDPGHGYIDGGRYIRPDAGFALKLPRGWKSSVQSGVLVSEASSGHEFLIVYRTRHATLADARDSIFGKDTRHDELVEQKVAGFDALVRHPIAGEKHHAELSFFEARGHAFMLVGSGGKARGGRHGPGRLLAGLSAVHDPALLEVHPRRLSIERLEHPTDLRHLSSSKEELAKLVVLNHHSADTELPAGRFVKRIVPGRASFRRSGSGASRPDRDRLGRVRRHSGVEHLAHARKDGHRRAHERAARREHP